MNLLTKDSQTFLQRKDITKADGLIAFIFYLYIISLTCIYMYSMKHGVLDNLSGNNTKIIFGSVMLLLLIVPLSLILTIRKQSLSSIGFCKVRRRQLIFCAILLIGYICYYIIFFGFSVDLFFRLYFYILAVGFLRRYYSEVLFGRD